MWEFLAEVVSPIEKVRLTLAARRYARHLGLQLQRAYGGGDVYTAAQIRVESKNADCPFGTSSLDTRPLWQRRHFEP